MKIISHRGNIVGPVERRENAPSYIDAAIKLGYDVEVDVRYHSGEFWLGHDNPQYKVSDVWIRQRKQCIWFHCKDLDSVSALSTIDVDIIKFCHASDPYVMISNGKVWVHDMTLNLDSNCVIPLIDDKQIATCKECSVYAICTDYPAKIR